MSTERGPDRHSDLTLEQSILFPTLGKLIEQWFYEIDVFFNEKIPIFVRPVIIVKLLSSISPNLLWLMLNNSYANPFFGPIGGGTDITDVGIRQLEEAGIDQSHFVKPKIPERGIRDMAMLLPIEKIFGFLKFWLQRNDREKNAMRELMEELGPSEDGPLSLEDFFSITLSFAGFNIMCLVPGGKLPVRFSHLHPAGELILVETFTVSNLDDSRLYENANFYLATEDEIMQGKTDSGTRISQVCKFLLLPNLYQTNGERLKTPVFCYK